MAIQTINIGNRVNDGLGDDLRTAFEKVNANFTELNAELTVTASNVGTTGAGIFKQKVDSNFEFKSIVAGNSISLDEGIDGIVINNVAPAGFTQIDTDSGTIIASSYPRITIEGKQAAGSSANGPKDIVVNTNGGSKVQIYPNLPFTEILTTYDFGPLGAVTEPGGSPILAPGEPASPATNFDPDSQFKYTTQLALAASNVDFGTLTYEGRIVFDFGVIG